METKKILSCLDYIGYGYQIFASASTKEALIKLIDYYTQDGFYDALAIVPYKRCHGHEDAYCLLLLETNYKDN